MKKQRILIKNFNKIIILIFLFIMIIPLNSFGVTDDETNEQTLKGQQEEFKIEDFIESSKEYGGDFFEGLDINEMLNDAIKGNVDNNTLVEKIWSLLGNEVTTSIKSMVSILIIIIIHSILKAVSESLENDGISKLIYYVQYILIVTIIMGNFSDIIKLVQDTSNNLVGFMNILVPLLIALMMYTGSITTSTVLEPIILFLINFVGNLIQTIIIPLVLVATSLIVISKISDQVQVDKLAKFLKSGIVWFLGIVLTIFVGVVSLEGTLSSSVDGITAKTTKAIVSSAIPVVGKILGDTVDSVLGCGIILKNAVGMIGVLIVVGICILPIIKLGTLTICYNILAGIIEPIADNKIVGVIEQIGDIFKLLLGILCAISVMIIIGTTLVIRISNSGMMYR